MTVLGFQGTSKFKPYQMLNPIEAESSRDIDAAARWMMFRTSLPLLEKGEESRKNNCNNLLDQMKIPVYKLIMALEKNNRKSIKIGPLTRSRKWMIPQLD